MNSVKSIDFSKLDHAHLIEFLQLNNFEPDSNGIYQAASLFNELIQRNAQDRITVPVMDLYIASLIQPSVNSSQGGYDRDFILTADFNIIYQFGVSMGLPFNDPNLKSRVIRILDHLGLLSLSARDVMSNFFNSELIYEIITESNNLKDQIEVSLIHDYLLLGLSARDLEVLIEPPKRYLKFKLGLDEYNDVIVKEGGSNLDSMFESLDGCKIRFIVSDTNKFVVLSEFVEIINDVKVSFRLVQVGNEDYVEVIPFTDEERRSLMSDLYQERLRMQEQD